MADELDWSLTTWEGNRRRQHRDFLALSFREKIEVLEQLSEITEFFRRRRREAGIDLPLLETRASD